MLDLTDYKGIVTGASSGIGLAIAEALAGAGAQVYCISRTGSPKDAAYISHRNMHHLKGDISDPVGMASLIMGIAEKEGLDYLINNAGITIKKRAETITPEEFAHVQSVNVNAPFNLSVLCYPYLKNSPYKGRIINISSMAAHLGFSQVVPYCASKSAILGLTRALAVEWAQDNITVNSIAPGWFPTEMTKQVMDEQRKGLILNRMPLHAFGVAKDIGALAAFLLSEHATYITGNDYPVDGGALAYGF